MFTHPDTLCSLSDLEYRHRLQEATQDRIAAGAQAGRQSPQGAARAMVLTIASCLGRLMMRPSAAQQSLTTAAQVGVQARPAGRAA
jgi:hypothetical protein